MIAKSGKEKTRLTLLTLFYIPLLMLYAFVDAASVGDGGYQILVYGIILILLFSISIINKFYLFTRDELAVIASIVSIIVVGIIPLSWSTIATPHHILGDISTLFLIIITFEVLYKDELRSLTSPVLAVFGAVLLIAGIYASSNPDPINGRFEAPEVLVIALFSYLLVQSPRIIVKAIAAMAVGILTYLSFRSGFRTHIILILLGLVLALMKGIEKNKIGVFIILVLSAAIIYTYYTDIMNVLINSRFKLLLSGSVDESTIERYNEVKDVVRDMSLHWTIADYILGSGHGAYYIPYYSYIARNVSANGLVHNIHFGPILVYFRYGVLGAVMLIIMVSTAIRVYLRANNDTERIVSIAGLLYLVDFLARNVLVDPIAIFVLSAVMVQNIKMKQLKSIKVGLKNELYG